MPKKSKRKNKNTGKPKNRASDNPEVGSDVSTSQGQDVRYHENPVKPDTDPNEYRVVELPNGLVALLISCPTNLAIEKADRMISKIAKYSEPTWYQEMGQLISYREQLRCSAVCCLCVNAGYFSDPHQVSGVSRVAGAAILNFPYLYGREISSECKKILRQTGAPELVSKSETTIIYTKVTHRVYREVIQHFGYALERATIPKSWTERSRQLVLSLEDGRRMSLTPQEEKAHIFSQFVSKKHPAKTFGKHFAGSLRHIDHDKVYREVQKFRKRHYSANRMTVVMKAELPLDTLETYVKECFSRITNNGLPPQLFDSYNFANSVENTKFRRIWRIDSADCNEMYVKWIIPPSSWLYRPKSLEFLGWLFSYGGAGSLLSYLKMKKWATEVHGRVVNEPAWDTSLYSTFCVSVTLTAIGNSKNKLDVLDAIYSYINFLRREGPQKSIYDDVRIIRNAEFRYQKADLRKVINVAKLAEDMHIYPSTDYLAAPFFWYEYDPVSLSTCMDLMTPAKGCIVVTDGNFGEHPEIKLADRREGEQSADIPEDWIVRWQTIEPFPGFKLPERNIFCPDNLRMIEAPAVLPKYPVKVHSDSMSEVWYKFDAEFREPKCHMNFCYASPLPLESPENAAMLQLFGLVLKDLTYDKFYPATVAGLSYTIESYFLGLGIEASGYTQKLPLLTQLFAQSVAESYHFLTKSLFETKKKELLDRYSEIFSSNLNLAKQIRDSILIPGQWTEVEKHVALSRLQFEKFQHFMKHFVDHVYTKCLVEGNIAEADAVKNALKVVEVSQCGPLSRNIPRMQKLKIPRGKHCCTVKAFELDSSDVTVENYYQFDDSSMKMGGMLRLLAELSRTLGVQGPTRSKGSASEIGVNHYARGFLVSGTSTIKAKHIAFIDAEIERQQQIALNFLENSLGSMLELIKEAIITNERETVNTILSECANNWNDIVNGDYDFGKLPRQLDALHEMNLADVHKWIKYMADDSNIRKLSIRIVGDKYSRADFSTVKTQPDKSKTGPNKIPFYRLQYLTEHAGQSGNTSYNCITDIYEFKKELEASNTNVTS